MVSFSFCTVADINLRALDNGQYLSYEVTELKITRDPLFEEISFGLVWMNGIYGFQVVYLFIT